MKTLLATITFSAFACACAARPQPPQAPPPVAKKAPTTTITHAEVVTASLCSAWQGDGRGCEVECLDGIASSCMAWAERLSTGRGVATDSARALRFFLRACDTGSAAGCEQAAERIGRGLGEPADEARRVELLQRACDLGATTACSAATRTFLRPVSATVTPSEESSRRSLEQACLAGNQTACETVDGELVASPIVAP